MNNINVKRNNYKKFKSHSRCSCIECRFNHSRVSNVRIDYFDEDELCDKDGWI